MMHLIDKTPRFMRSFFFLFTVGFMLWMLFADANDIRSQFRLGQKLRELEAEKEFYKREIEQVNHDRQELLTNDELLEKFAREKYLMKKPEEDVYVIVKE